MCFRVFSPKTGSHFSEHALVGQTQQEALGMTDARRLSFALIVGLGGLIALLTLGFWQLSRLDEKLEQIQALEKRLAAPPLTLEAGQSYSLTELDYRRAKATGRFTSEASVRMITSRKAYGPGSLYFTTFETTDGLRLIVQRGFAPEFTDEDLAPPSGAFEIAGVLRAPREVGFFTPDPDPKTRLIFARDLSALRSMLDAAPLLLVLDAPPQPLGGAPLRPQRFPAPAPEQITLPNNHLGYAITWFCLAAIWAAMTGLLLWRRDG